MENKTFLIRFVIGTNKNILRFKKDGKIITIGNYFSDLSLIYAIAQYTKECKTPKESCLMILSNKCFETVLNKQKISGDFQTKIIDSINEINKIVDSNYYRYIFVIDDDFITNDNPTGQSGFGGLNTHYLWYKKIKKSDSINFQKLNHLPHKTLTVSEKTYNMEIMKICNDYHNIFKFKNYTMFPKEWKKEEKFESSIRIIQPAQNISAFD